MAGSIFAISIAKLKELMTQEQHNLKGAEEKLRSLMEELEHALPFVQQASENRAKNDNTNNRVNQLISAAYDAEDAIEAYLLKMKHGRPDRIFVGCIDHFNCRSLNRLQNKINDIKRRVVESALESGLGENVGGGEPSDSSMVEPSIEKKALINAEDDVVGLDEDTKTLVKMLVEGEPRRAIVSIIGMGGLGKTTLANKVYKHNRVVGHFGDRGCINVSQKYQERELLLDIVETFWGDRQRALMESMDDESLKSKIFERLRVQKYLLVVDDVWKVEAWEFLKDVLPDNSNGSRVLLTTRIRDVAQSADPMTSPYDLRLLAEEESWELLRRKAFPQMSGRCAPNFEEVGREIAHNCGGLPLQIVVLGGLLYKKKKIDDWIRVRDGVDYELPMEDRTSRVLALSYSDLPSRLKPCFLYFTHYPEDAKIITRKLIRIWVAEGLIQWQVGERAMEDVAEDYIEELIMRCLIQVVETNPNGDIKTCRIHDLLLELSISEAKREHFSCVYGEDAVGGELNRERRLSVQHSLGNSVLECKQTQLRSLLCFRLNHEWQKIRPVFKGSKLLRVIDLEIEQNRAPTRGDWGDDQSHLPWVKEDWTEKAPIVDSESQTSPHSRCRRHPGVP